MSKYFPGPPQNYFRTKGSIEEQTVLAMARGIRAKQRQAAKRRRRKGLPGSAFVKDLRGKAVGYKWRSGKHLGGALMATPEEQLALEQRRRMMGLS